MHKHLFLVLLLLLMTGVVAAQEDTPDVFCVDLSEADCEFLQNSAETMADVDSANFTLAMNVVESDADELASTYLLAVTVDGRYAVDQEAMPDMANMDQAQQAVTDTVNALDAAVTVNVYVPEGEVEEGVQPTAENMTFEARLVDGNGYINLASFNRPNAMDDQAVWHGTSVTDLLAFISQERDQTMRDILSTGVESGIGAVGAAQDEVFRSYVDVLRLAVVNEGVLEFLPQEVNVFYYEFDIAGYLNDPEGEEALRTRYEAMYDQDVDQRVEATQQAFANANARYVTYIGLDSGYVYRREIVLSDVSLSGLNLGEEQPEEVDLYIAVNYTDFNDIEAITVPESATLHPLEEIQEAILAYLAEPVIVVVPVEIEGLIIDVEGTPEATDEAVGTDGDADIATPSADVDTEVEGELDLELDETPEALDVTPDVALPGETPELTLEAPGS